MNHLFSKFFFVRYFEDGPHLRLRFDQTEKDQRDTLIKTATTFFDEYISSLGTQYKESYSLQIVEYEPEVDRYGGPNGTAISESLFFESSKVVLALIAKSQGRWDYQRSLSAAVALHLTYAHCMNITRQNLASFFEGICLYWLPSAASLDSRTTELDFLKAKQEIVTVFRKKYESQRVQIHHFISNLWNLLDDQKGLNDEVFDSWLSGLAPISLGLTNVIKNGNFREPPGRFPGNVSLIEGDELKKWKLYQSHLHMTNNRLGILNHDESYLGFVLARSTEDLTGVG